MTAPIPSRQMPFGIHRLDWTNHGEMRWIERLGGQTRPDRIEVGAPDI